MAKKSGKVEEKSTNKASKSSGDVTYSLCIPSTIISKSNARNLEQVTNVAYQVAKAATIFQVSEIVVLDIPPKENGNEGIAAVKMEGKTGNVKVKFGDSEDDPVPKSTVSKAQEREKDNDEKDCNAVLFATLLQYFVTPKYLTKAVFNSSKYNKKFKYADKLPPLSNLPFMNNNNVGDHFKEGLTTAKHTPKIQKRNKKAKPAKKLSVTKFVNIGDATPLELNGVEVPVNVRVTVDIKNKKVVSPQAAYGVTGSKSAFGYYVRLAKLITAVFTELSFPDGYTDSVFINANNYFSDGPETSLLEAKSISKGNALLVVGKLDHLETCFKKETIEGVSTVTEMFDSELKVPSGLRVEDAVMVSLAKII